MGSEVQSQWPCGLWGNRVRESFSDQGGGVSQGQGWEVGKSIPGGGNSMPGSPEEGELALLGNAGGLFIWPG